MKHYKNKINRGLIVLSKGERIAVITLLVIIAILLAFSVFRPALRFSKEDEWAFHNLDSLIAIREENMKKQVTEIASSNEIAETNTIVPPSNPPKPSSNTVHSQDHHDTPSSKKIPVLDLNTTDSLALVALPQIGEVMASRIQRYRDRLGGFVSYEQLYEIKGMDSTRYATVKPYLLLDPTNIRKLEVNRDEFKTLLRHPYLEYDQVKAIVNFREKKGLIRNWEQLHGIVGEVNPLLERYVSY